MFSLLLTLAATLPAEAPLSTDAPAAEDRDIQTPDGAWIHLHRHAFAGPPVLVVHGLSSNHYCWDIAPDRSIARALNAAGFDAWLLDLRGHGDARAHRSPPGWSMDDYGRQDIPAAIAEIQATTGYKKVGYVGHSMGGMVEAIYQAAFGDDALAAVVIVGSPVDFRDSDPLLDWARSAFVTSAILPSFASPTGARGLSLFGERAPMHVDELLFNSLNLNSETQKLMFMRAISPVYRHEFLQLVRIVDAGRFVSADGAVDYVQTLAQARAPTLVIAGRADRIAPAERVRAFYDASGSPEKAFFIAGRESGLQADYGHMDMVMGDRAETEIFPRITSWLAGR